MDQIALPSGRMVFLLAAQQPELVDVSAPFAVLFPAFDQADMRAAERLADPLLDQGCLEFCCVGPESERLHDALDAIVEARGAVDVVTTWDVDVGEGVEYFLCVAGAGRFQSLLAFILERPDLVAMLGQISTATGG